MNEAARKAFELKNEKPKNCEFEIDMYVSTVNSVKIFNIVKKYNERYRGFKQAYETQQKRIDELVEEIENAIESDKSEFKRSNPSKVVSDIELILWGLKNE